MLLLFPSDLGNQCCWRLFAISQGFAVFWLLRTYRGDQLSGFSQLRVRVAMTSPQRVAHVASSLPTPTVGVHAPATGLVLTQPPSIIYQTEVRDGKQDTSTPCFLSLQLSLDAHAALLAGMRSGRSLSDLIHGALRRFDLTELMVYNEDEGELLGLRLPQKCFEYKLSAVPSVPVVHVKVHRKELPVSKSFGGAPFVFVFGVLAAPHHEVFVTSKFCIASKESSTAPKRTQPAKRGPPPCKPFAAPAEGKEALINAMLYGTSTPDAQPAPLKRARGASPPCSARFAVVSPTLPRLVTVDEDAKEWEYSKVDMDAAEDELLRMLPGGDAAALDDDDLLDFSTTFDPAFEAVIASLERSDGNTSMPQGHPRHSGDTGGPLKDPNLSWMTF